MIITTVALDSAVGNTSTIHHDYQSANAFEPSRTDALETRVGVWQASEVSVTR